MKLKVFRSGSDVRLLSEDGRVLVGDDGKPHELIGDLAPVPSREDFEALLAELRGIVLDAKTAVAHMKAVALGTRVSSSSESNPAPVTAGQTTVPTPPQFDEETYKDNLALTSHGRAILAGDRHTYEQCRDAARRATEAMAAQSR